MKIRSTLLIALAVTLTACRSATEPPLESLSYAQRFDDIWSNFDRTYSYFTLKGIDWSAARDTYRPRAVAAVDEDSFRAVILDMLATLHDAHVWLVKPDGGCARTFVLSRPANWNSQVWQSYLARGGAWESLGGGSGMTTIEGVPYVAIRTWATGQFDVGAFDAALGQFRGAPVMIVDVRMNGGGNDAIAYDVAGRFATSEHTTEWFQFRNGPAHTDFGGFQRKVVSPRGPWQFSGVVLLLTGRGVASSNESFVAAMRELPNVIVAGDTTAGASGNPGMYPLGAGWQYSVSRWIAYTAERDVVEDRGIAPARYVAWSPDDWQTGTDATLDWALQWAKQVTRSP